jgi:hypothetical protein
MKSIFDSSFKYRPGFDTDLRQTFFRIRHEQQSQIRAEHHAVVPQDQQASEGSSSTARY